MFGSGEIKYSMENNLVWITILIYYVCKLLKNVINADVSGYYSLPIILTNNKSLSSLEF